MTKKWFQSALLINVVVLCLIVCVFCVCLYLLTIVAT
jgi:hypothetical protein